MYDMFAEAFNAAKEKAIETNGPYFIHVVTNEGSGWYLISYFAYIARYTFSSYEVKPDGTIINLATIR